jgi:putative hydrolase of the HAD superfamily
LGLRAVVFDYGMVLTGPPDPKAHASLLRITGLPLDRFENFYWADRHDYDLGVLTGIDFWEKFIADAGLSLEPGVADELNQWDSQMWTAQNPVMLAWHVQLKERGLRTAILSNMGDSVLANIEREFAWIQDFDVLVWSYQLHMAKPDPEIYRYVLKELGTLPDETLFLDDKLVNIQAARALGIRAIHFSTVEQLRADLIVAGLASELPLP